ncbi:MAG: serine/threonine-protein kinase [Myxococcota bacterium]|nr:serine/threonine-protein kinase [Myxococcota bacterium]
MTSPGGAPLRTSGDSTQGQKGSLSHRCYTCAPPAPRNPVVLPNTADLPYDFGPYTLLSVLGEGGMARVYRAEKQGRMGFSTETALKVMKRKAGKNSEFIKLLNREAIVGGFLRHPNIVRTIDFDDVDNHYYIAMEYVEGETLESLLSIARTSETGRLPLLSGIDTIQQICLALSYAHNLRDRNDRPLEIIHRDIKPGNIMVSKHNVTKLTDFGIVKAAIETGVNTQTNVVRGTPLYMSPEQATGRPLDHRSDLFSVGLILYEIMTGKRLFEMKDIVSTMENIARAQIGSAPEELAEILPGIDLVFRKLMQLNPQARYDDAADLEQALAELIADYVLTNTERGETTSVRESLKALSELASSKNKGTAVTQTPDPTLPDTSNRIAIDRQALDQASNITFAEVHALSEDKNMDTSDPEVEVEVDDTAPWSDPVVRRNPAGLTPRTGGAHDEVD